MSTQTCLHPVYVRAIGIEVPCGICFECLKAKKREWVTRLLAESQSYSDSCFVTLTYDGASLPKDNSLHYEHIQLFLKRLRWHLDSIGDPKIRYLCVGEYGPRGSRRPHYHLILFGLRRDTLDLYRPHPSFKYTVSRLLNRFWSYGFNTVGTVTEASIKYCASYCFKKLGTWDKGKDVYYENLARIKTEKMAKLGSLAEHPFDKGAPKYIRKRPMCHTSKGIGRTWCLEQAEQLRKTKYIQRGQFKQAIPRYFRNLLGMTVKDYKDVIDAGEEKMIKEFMEYSHRSPFTGDIRLTYPTEGYIVTKTSSNFYTGEFLLWRKARASQRHLVNLARLAQGFQRSLL